MLKGTTGTMWSHPWTLVARLRQHRSAVACLAACLACVVLGVHLRLASLSHRFYWHDEAYTSLRASGHTANEAIADLFTALPISVAAVQRYQQPSPDKTPLNTVRSLASEEPQHSPLYFLVCHLWIRWFGSSIESTRSLSLLFSLLALPALYWLCLELFSVHRRHVSRLAVAFFLVSPVHVWFAVEARPYALVTLITLVSSASLLAALRIGSPKSWSLYTGLITMGLYVFPFFAFVVLAHIFYTLIRQRFSLLDKIFLTNLLPAFVALLLFLPWLFIMFTNMQRISLATGWSTASMNFSRMLREWVVNFASVFVAASPDASWQIDDIIRVLVIIFVLSCFVSISGRGDRRSAYFVLLLFAVPFMALAIPDLVVGGRRSVSTRYLMPSYVAILLGVAYFLAMQIQRNHGLKQKLWEAATAALLVASAGSSLISSQQEVSWGRITGFDNPEVTRIVNRSDRPVLIVVGPWPTNLGNTLALSHTLQEEARFQLVTGPNAPDIPNDGGDVFMFGWSGAEVREVLQSDGHYRLQPVLQNVLWRVEQQPR
jgi:uncharacterized membrane protein